MTMSLKETHRLMTFICTTIILAMVLMVVLLLHFFPPNTIESELESHLITNNDNIVIRSVSNVLEDLDGWHSFQVHCFNKNEDIFFTEKARFNPETKELDGYNVLEYR